MMSRRESSSLAATAMKRVLVRDQTAKLKIIVSH
jgi:hypothetical protein